MNHLDNSTPSCARRIVNFCLKRDIAFQTEGHEDVVKKNRRNVSKGKV